jgi:SAM-dependent methyltransferase
MNDQLQTWHYGLVARHWAEHNIDGPEIAYFQSHIERNGQPALDSGCGTGRLLIPFLQAGLDVDGCDVSPDMLSLCREQADRESLRPRLYQQALHELELPRVYQTIVVCGAWGLGVSRQQDFIALKRFYHHLKPGGVLLLDHHLPYGDARAWQFWQKEMRNQLPEPWPDKIGKAPLEEGSEYELHSRIVAFDPLEQRVTREMRTVLWRDGQCMAEEDYTLYENFYFRNELHQMLEQAGFKIEAIQGDYTEEEATADHDVIVFIARKQS